MKDLILISAYCPDYERLNMLDKCVNSIVKYSDKYDTLICSHTHIPKNISDKVDFTFYDKENDLISDPTYMLPLFAQPDLNKDWMIKSTYVKTYNTFLSCYRILISGINIAKIYGYNKIHYIEYDSIINNIDELNSNSLLLNDYDAIFYYDKKHRKSNNKYIIQGSVVSFKISNINDIFYKFDRDILLEKFKNLTIRTAECLTENLFIENNNKVFYKERISDSITINLSVITKRTTNKYWAVPYYEEKTDTINTFIWNHNEYDDFKIDFLINNDKKISYDIGKNFTNPKYRYWRCNKIDKIDNINNIKIFVNNELTNEIDFNKVDREMFKKTNNSSKVDY
jgi:hypothetical protein